MLRVAHYVDQYPLIRLQFIYDQVLHSSKRADTILAGCRFGALLKVPSLTEVPVAVFHDLSAWPFACEGLCNRNYNRLCGRFLWQPYAHRLTRFLLAQLRQRPVDLLHAHFGMAAAKLSEVRRASGIPLVTTFYGVDASAQLRDPRWNRAYRRLFEAGDLFIVLSDSVVDRLVLAGCPREKITVWNIGIDFSRYPYMSRQRSAGRLRIICAARFVEKKGHAILLETFRQLPGNLGAELTLLGFGPLLKSRILPMIESYGLQKKVRVMDTQECKDFDALYAQELERHDLFVLPSIEAANGDDEAGPALTMICAQASGMPAISTRFPGAEKSVSDGETGIFCDMRSPESLAAKIQLLAQDPDLAERIGRAGRERVVGDFSLESQRKRLEAHYRRLLGKAECDAKT